MEQQLFFHQRFLLAPGLLTSLDVLIKPLPELAEWLEARIEENPLLTSDAPSRGFQGNKITETTLVVEQRDLYEILELQAREAFDNPAQLKEAIDLIHNIDEKGFLPSETGESETLSVLQTFDPPGIAARSVCECLKLQLKRKNSSKLVLALIEHHYDDLLHYRFKKICKSLSINEIKLRNLIKKELSRLTLAPAGQYKREASILWIPDLVITEGETGWKIEINTSLLPRVKIGLRYAIPLDDEETKKYLKWKDKEARFVLTSIRKRNATLLKLGKFLIKTQSDYFEGNRELPEKTTVEEVAEKLGMHRSTVYRAISNKAISSPRGILALDAFFRHASSIPSTIEEKIQQLISNEDKNHPLSDSSIAKQLQQFGFSCCTRTVTKYRNSLSLPKAQLRKI
jgi:RNA polymerase sigma-54 factor